MTRLSGDMVVPLIEELDMYDRELVKKTGKNLKQIAAVASGMAEAEIDKMTSSISTAVIPVTAGDGAIKGFASAVRAIICHLGFTSFLTEYNDVMGLAEGVEKGADIVFLADDNRFIALNLKERFIVDNAVSTGRGFATALQCMAGDLSGRKVLVIGAGKVGRSAMSCLNEYKARVAVFDNVRAKAEEVAVDFGYGVEKDLSESLRHYTLILDASPAQGVFHVDHITPSTFIAACGIPLILDRDAYMMVKERLIHDPLQIGVATMLISAVFCR